MVESRSLPVGTALFHGTSAKGFLIPRGPAFFGDTYGVAKTFINQHKGGKAKRVIQLEVTEEIPKLALITEKTDFDRIAEEVGIEVGENTESRIDLVQMAGYDGWIIPNNYVDGADIMILQPARWLVFVEEFPER